MSEARFVGFLLRFNIEKLSTWSLLRRCIYIYIYIIHSYSYYFQVKLPLYGCDCYAYALLASGFVDLVVESCLKVR